MTTPFVGEIQLMGFGWAPKNTALCNGAELTASQYPALYALIGDVFGGNAGGGTFKLPDMRGRVPAGPDGNYVYQQGVFGGYETVPLTQATAPAHRHFLRGADEDGDFSYGVDRVFANVGVNPTTGTRPLAYGPAENLTPIGQGEVSSFGGGQPHTNVQPFLVINFTIALTGVFPSRN
ncbi:phage tail protein [Novosphingobium beihaiensis]|uniref:Tail fiber protein n=1 Tax=Novosphingobium beihaiensis TaxID=2930389 RepID=A0ABT0BK30_9SPHN|nr:tail fiber protein [Novosphingobium beihaiensis]MCJ2185389.1 tail fiber protein [Novosphingobium beihaiensis]